MSEPGRAVGRVTQVWLYPVKSLAGTSVTSAEVRAEGLAGDRARTVVDETGRPVRPKDATALARLSPVDADAIERRGGQRRARPYLQAQLRRLQRRGHLAAG